MKIWIITYSDGITYSGVFVEAWSDATTANSRATELQALIGPDNWAGYDVREVELDTERKD